MDAAGIEDAVEAEPTGYAAIGAMDAEPESITKWKAEQKARLEKLTEEEKAATAELETAAKAELEQWATQYAKKKSDKAATNATSEEAFIAKRDESGPGNSWERVAFLIDFNAKNSKKDTSAMKSLLIKLKAEGLKGR